MFVIKKPSCDYILLESQVVIVDNEKRKYFLFPKKENQVLFEKIFTKLQTFELDNNFSEKDIEKIMVLKNKGLVKISEKAIYQLNSEGNKLGRFETQNIFFSNYVENVPEFTKNLKEKKVCIIGAGALGSTIAVKLSAIGIKNIIVIDNDEVELDNLTRQIFYTPKQAASGTKKVNALGNFINNFYPETHYTGVTQFLKKPKDVFKYVPIDTDLMINTADSPRGLIDDWINKFSIENSIATIYTHHKSVGPFYIPKKSSCVKCLDKYLDEKTSGLFSSIKSQQNNLPNSKNSSFVTGTLMNEVIIFKMILAYFLGDEIEHYQNKIFTYYNSEFEIQIMEIKKNKECLCNIKK